MFDNEGYEKLDYFYEKAKAKGITLTIPDDVRVAKNPNDTSVKTYNYNSTSGIPNGYEGFDIGPETVKLYGELLRNSKTVVWNGPCGMIEKEQFREGSLAILKILQECTKDNGMVSIIGGGDTVSFVKSVPGADKTLTHLSTGGGATLEYLQGNNMPGIECLSSIDEID